MSPTPHLWLALAREDDLAGWIWFLLFFLAPLLSRVLRGLTKGSGEPEAEVGTAHLQMHLRAARWLIAELAIDACSATVEKFPRRQASGSASKWIGVPE